METRGSSEKPILSLSAPWLAALSAALTASASQGFSTSQVRSTSEQSKVGTRTDMPLIRPSSSGMTTPTALAAPVLDGTMETAAARPRRQSLCEPSRMRWLMV